MIFRFIKKQKYQTCPKPVRTWGPNIKSLKDPIFKAKIALVNLDIILSSRNSKSWSCRRWFSQNFVPEKTFWRYFWSKSTFSSLWVSLAKFKSNLNFSLSASILSSGEVVDVSLISRISGFSAKYFLIFQFYFQVLLFKKRFY